MNYLLGNERSEYQEDVNTFVTKSSGIMIQDGSIKKRNRKGSERRDLTRTTRKDNVVERDKEITETWSKVVGRKERKTNSENGREEVNNNKKKEIARNVVKKRKPLKTSAVVITVKDEQISYSEVLTWARQSVKLI